MAGAIILGDRAGWSVATWCYTYTVELVLKHSASLPQEVRKRFEEGLPPHMLGVMLTDLDGKQLEAVLDCLHQGYESEKRTRGAGWRSPSFWEPFMNGLQELIRLIDLDSRISRHRPAPGDTWKESAET